YLGELRDRFGNLGFAATAYNAGENGLSNYLSGGSLPSETRAYVIGITSYSVDDWKSSAPEIAAPALDKTKTFLDSCVALAERRKLREPAWQTEGTWMPWGVQIAAHANPDAARRLFFTVVGRLPAPLNA
ncbi:MAG: lytic transglycosylase domain-containing protein, partial [Rhizobium leguminosarum]|nr:lytic transglycosylase domain-containing protein [Rhizobium leguminosarum]